jgi:radical SAM superfamily enzyme YgiQ (UPF0313 family)
MNQEIITKKRILLALLPFWEPQIPPMGIACLKSHLEQNGYTVRTIDTNVLETFEEIHQNYMNRLKEELPEKRRGNFSNIGQDVMRNHMMAHIRRTDEQKYRQLVRILIRQNFFTDVNEGVIQELVDLLTEFYQRLETYWLNLMAESPVEVLGLSVFKGNLPAAMYVFRLTREKYPHVMTVMGGAVFAGTLTVNSPNFNNFVEKTRDYIDKIIVGEGEQLFLKMLEGELDETRRVYTIKDIDNSVFDLAKAQLPDYGNLELEFYPNMAAYTSRSCPFQCSFCTETVYWGPYRKKKPRQIVEELRQLYHKTGHQLYLMCDSLLNPVVNELATALIEADMSIYWDGYLRVDRHACDEDKVLHWRRGGLYRTRLGIESGSPHILELMGKQITPEETRNAVSTLANAGIKTTTYWVIGHPGETEADFQQTLEIIEDLKDHLYEAWCSPFNYYLSGQVHSDPWAKKSRLLYPEDAADMLVAQTWIVDEEPRREEMYRRVNRFVAHCKRLGIPNPYSMMDFYNADERWHRLHKNAVPSIVQFENKERVIDENKHAKKLVTAETKLNTEMDFRF